jgi:hypothetical protein
MDVKRAGTVRQKEFMEFVAAEFDAMDREKQGMLATSNILNEGYFQREISD